MLLLFYVDVDVVVVFVVVVVDDDDDDGDDDDGDDDDDDNDGGGGHKKPISASTPLQLTRFFSNIKPVSFHNIIFYNVP